MMAEMNSGGLAASRSDRSKTAAFELLASDLSGEFLGPAEHFRAKL